MKITYPGSISRPIPLDCHIIMYSMQTIPVTIKPTHFFGRKMGRKSFFYCEMYILWPSYAADNYDKMYFSYAGLCYSRRKKE